MQDRFPLVFYCMTKSEKSSRGSIYLMLVWMVVNVLLMLMLLPEDYMNLNNWIELALWYSSIVGLLSMKKWGASLTTFTLIYTLSLSVSIVIYYQIWLNMIRIIINALLTIYMFRSIFTDKF